MAEVEALRADWTALLGDSVHTDPDYVLWSLEAEAHVVRPHVVAIERDGQVESVVVARVIEARLPCKLGRTTVYAPTLRAICVVREGWLGRADAYTAEVILDELFAAIDRGEADVLIFRQLELDSVLHRAALARATFATRRQHEAAATCAGCSSSATAEHYLASGVAVHPQDRAPYLEPARARVRRAAVDQGLPRMPRISMRCSATPRPSRRGPTSAGWAWASSATTGSGARLAALAAHGWLRGYVLYLDGQPIAFELGELYRGRFDSLRRRVRPGTRSTPSRRLPPGEGDRGSRRRARLPLRLRLRGCGVQEQARAPSLRGRRPRHLRPAAETDLGQVRADGAARDLARRHRRARHASLCMERIKQWSRRQAL